jgi:hypothetical protein
MAPMESKSSSLSWLPYAFSSYNSSTSSAPCPVSSIVLSDVSFNYAPWSISLLTHLPKWHAGGKGPRIPPLYAQARCRSSHRPPWFLPYPRRASIILVQSINMATPQIISPIISHHLVRQRLRLILETRMYPLIASLQLPHSVQPRSNLRIRS